MTWQSLRGEPTPVVIYTEAATRPGDPPFVTLCQRIRAHHDAIAATFNTGLINALAESINTEFRLVARHAFGFHNIDALIALATLTVGERHPEPAHMNNRRAPMVTMNELLDGRVILD